MAVSYVWDVPVHNVMHSMRKVLFGLDWYNDCFWCLVQGGMGSALLSDPDKIEAVGIQLVILQIQCLRLESCLTRITAF